MTTVIAVYNSEGCVGRCDARCHDAHSAGCDCICGGKNHGAGFEQAVENNRELFGLKKEDIERYAAVHGLDSSKLVACDRLAVKSSRKANKAAKRELARRQEHEADQFELTP